MACVRYFKSSQFRSSQHSSLNNQQTRAKLTGLKIDFNICMGKLPCSRDSGTNFCETHQENLNDQFGSLKSRFEYWLMHPVSKIINLFINVVIYETKSCTQQKKNPFYVLMRLLAVIGLENYLKSIKIQNRYIQTCRLKSRQYSNYEL